MTRTPWSVIREPDDSAAKTRVSLGEPRDVPGGYMVFRGEPRDVVTLLETALKVAKSALPQGVYIDQRGRPQG